MVKGLGEIVITEPNGGQILPNNWTGVCNDYTGKDAFWYVGNDDGVRSFIRLAAKNVEAALVEAEPFAALVGNQTSTPTFSFLAQCYCVQKLIEAAVAALPR